MSDGEGLGFYHGVVRLAYGGDDRNSDLSNISIRRAENLQKRKAEGVVQYSHRQISFTPLILISYRRNVDGRPTEARSVLYALSYDHRNAHRVQYRTLGL